MIHEQVKMQLEYLKKLVAYEEKEKDLHPDTYIPSKRKWFNIQNLDEYEKEILKNGDKNLIVWVNIKNSKYSALEGIFPFAKRYVGEKYLVHRFKTGGELLFTIYDKGIEIVKER